MVPGFLIFIAIRRPRTLAQRMPTSAMSLNWVQTATPSLIEVHLFEDANEDHGEDLGLSDFGLSGAVLQPCGNRLHDSPVSAYGF